MRVTNFTYVCYYIIPRKPDYVILIQSYTILNVK